MTTLDRKLILLTTEAWQLVDLARSPSQSRSEYLEQLVWRRHAKLASQQGLERPERPQRGKYDRRSQKKSVD